MAGGEDREILTDPFLRVVQRRHPDVDIVVLSQESDHEDVSPARLDVDEVEHATSAIITQLVDAQDVATTSDISQRWELGDTRNSIQRLAAASASGVGPAVAGEALDDMAASLNATGWAVEQTAGSTPRLTGSKDQYLVHALYAAEVGRLSVDVASPVALDEHASERVDHGE